MLRKINAADTEKTRLLHGVPSVIPGLHSMQYVALAGVITVILCPRSLRRLHHTHTAQSWKQCRAGEQAFRTFQLKVND